MFCKINRLIIILFLMTLDVNAGKYSDILQWLNINPSARSAALGVSFYGISAGAAGALFNPGVPALDRDRSLNIQHGLLPANILYDTIAYIEPNAGVGSAAFAIQYFTTDKMKKIKNGVIDGTFRNFDIAINLGYSYSIMETLAAGMNLKIIQSNIDKYTAQGFGADIGLIGKMSPNTKYGLSVQNISSRFTYQREIEYLPFSIACGLSHTLQMMKDEVDLTFSLGGKYLDYGSYEIGFGMEHTMYKQFTIRGGYQYNTNDNRLKFPANITAGAGISVYNIFVDYAWVPYGEIGYTHRFGLGYNFSGTKKGKLSKEKILLKTLNTMYAPSAGSMKIIVNWKGAEKINKWRLEIIDSYNLKVKTIKGTDQVSEIIWNGKNDANFIVLDGNYSLNLVAEDSNGRKYRSEILDVIVDTTPPVFNVTYSHQTITPDGDGNSDEVNISLNVTDNNMVDSYRFKIFNDSGKLVKEFSGTSLIDEFSWNGKDDYYNKVVDDGEYTFVAQAKDIAGNITVLENEIIVVKLKPKLVTKRIKIEEDEDGLKISLTSKVLFDMGQTKLKNASHESLDEVVGVLNAYSRNKVSIEGHSDSVGSNEVNKKVSYKRANAVTEYIVKKGINIKRITIIGWGEEKPIASNRTRSGRARNRRVEIRVLKEKTE